MAKCGTTLGSQSWPRMNDIQLAFCATKQHRNLESKVFKIEHNYWIGPADQSSVATAEDLGGVLSE
jgi:hypothetical protein